MQPPCTYQVFILCTLAMLVSIYLCTIVTLQDPSVGSDLCPGMYVAVKSTKYHERPLIGKVCDTDGGMVGWLKLSGWWGRTLVFGSSGRGGRVARPLSLLIRFAKMLYTQTLHLRLAKGLHQPP